MQNITSLLGGSPAATAYLSLCASSFRVPVFELLALNENGTTAMDLTSYLKSGNASFSDEAKVHTASFVLANPSEPLTNGVAIFDRYGGGSAATILAENRILRFRKGLKNPTTGTAYFLPAFYGRIAEVAPSYNAEGEQTISVTLMDALKHTVKQKFTSRAYQNCTDNVIATDLLKRFGKFTDPQISLYASDRSFGFMQVPDMALLDALKTIYEPSLRLIRADEAGVITTAPRLGSPEYGSGLMGYPDQATEPDSGLVSYTIPDDLVDSITEAWQDFNEVFTQTRVFGRSVADLQSLAPIRELYVEAGSAIERNGKRLQDYSYTQGGTGNGSNSIVGENIIIKVNYETNSENPRVIFLSNLPYLGDWDADIAYRRGDAVTFLYLSEEWVFVCMKPAIGVGQSPDNPIYWARTEVKRPFELNILDGSASSGVTSSSQEQPWWNSVRIWNEDPRYVGQIDLTAITPTYARINIEGRTYSTFSSRRGGFAYGLTIYGQPVLSRSRTLTAFSDYNVSLVTEETLTDPFSDHVTYQSVNQPFAMSIPITVLKDGISLGTVTADQTDLSGVENFGVDFERGRVILKDVTYQSFAEDSTGTNPYSTGGTAESTAEEFNTVLLSPVVSQMVLQTRRDGDSIYLFTGLTVGVGYDIRLSFADPVASAAGERLFSVYGQGAKLIEGLDIFAATGGSNIAYQTVLSGVTPDTSGEIELRFTQHDPTTASLLPECDNGSGSALGLAMVSAIEVLDPTSGAGGAFVAVNCGGAAYAIPPPVITASYGYSPIQQTYQAQQYAIDNPLISSQEECQNTADFWVNYLQWRRNPIIVRTSSVPHLQPGDLIKFYHARINCDVWAYVQQIDRDVSPPGDDNNGGDDADTFRCYVLFVQSR